MRPGPGFLEVPTPKPRNPQVQVLSRATTFCSLAWKQLTYQNLILIFVLCPAVDLLSQILARAKP